MYRFFVPPEQIDSGQIEITGDDVNHIRNVLRMNTGDEVVVSCGRGTDYFCRIEMMDTNRVVLAVGEERPVRTELPVQLVLFQALPKADKMDLIVQKAVELGAARIVPVQTRRCVVKLDEKKALKKVQRWRSIAQAAAKQSGRGILPEVSDVISFSGAMEAAKQLDLTLIPYELYDDMAETVSVIDEARERESVGIFIGPEGGFERGEVETAMENGAVPVSLGKRILRTETAGLAVLSVLMFGIEAKQAGEDSEKWKPI